MSDEGKLKKHHLSSTTAAAWQTEMDNLHKWNTWCGWAHLIQGTIVWLFSFTIENAKNMSMPVTSLFQNWDSGYPVQVLGLLFRFNFVQMSSYFSLLAAAQHFYILWKWSEYENMLSQGYQRWRWYEYMISSSLIITLCFIIWGNFEWVQLGGVFLINTATIMFGDQFEQMNKGRSAANVDWTCFYYGAICGTSTWWVMWYNIFTDEYNSYYPWYAWAFLIGYNIFFYSFPYNLWQQYRQEGNYNNANYANLSNGGYLYGEKVFCFLSLTSKSILLWMIAGAFTDASAVIWQHIAKNY